ncbi:MAG: 50S ribosomal protein L22 [Nanoarchaeota archaeon]|nr:50S ribosomal protein L22 [Nanoarchaeota archaeon]MBU1644487.1 50S ribosomal protein L22 [Nanoarchaeota archaeon]MBU1976491.1 50S ribosomal protein L22 [Nanoarchaeota archaeon]
MKTATNKTEQKNFAVAKALSLSISTKHCIELCDALRYKNTSYAKQYLAEVIDLKRPVPFKKFYRNVGHKVGMAAGRFPKKAAKELLKVIESVEANAQFKGMNTSQLKITKLLANKGSIPFTGGRHHRGTKRTSLEVEVSERRGVKEESKKGKKKEAVKEAATEEVKETVKEKNVEAKKVETKKVEEKKVTENHLKKESKEELKKESKPETKETKLEVKKEEVKKEVKATIKVPVKELSSEELLAKAQEKAAELNRKEKQKEDSEKVEKLYHQLKQEGSLRDRKVN